MLHPGCSSIFIIIIIIIIIITIIITITMQKRAFQLIGRGQSAPKEVAFAFRSPSASRKRLSLGSLKCPWLRLAANGSDPWKRLFFCLVPRRLAAEKNNGRARGEGNLPWSFALVTNRSLFALVFPRFSGVFAKRLKMRLARYVAAYGSLRSAK